MCQYHWEDELEIVNKNVPITEAVIDIWQFFGVLLAGQLAIGQAVARAVVKANRHESWSVNNVYLHVSPSVCLHRGVRTRRGTSVSRHAM